MKSKHLKLEWRSEHDNIVIHRSKLGDAAITEDNISTFAWSCYLSCGVYRYGVCKTLLQAQKTIENHLISKK